MSAFRVNDELRELPPSGGPATVVHLELHTGQRQAASGFYADLLGWRTRPIENRWGTYHVLLLGGGLDRGIVKCGTHWAGRLPYVEIDHIEAATDLAGALGALVVLSLREGPAGRRSVVHSTAGVEIALWQQNR